MRTNTYHFSYSLQKMHLPISDMLLLTFSPKIQNLVCAKLEFKTSKNIEACFLVGWL